MFFLLLATYNKEELTTYVSSPQNKTTKIHVSISIFLLQKNKKEKCKSAILAFPFCSYSKRGAVNYYYVICYVTIPTTPLNFSDPTCVCLAPASMLHPCHYLYYLQGQRLNYVHSHSLCQQSMMITHKSKDGHSMHSMQLCNAR